MRIDGGKLRRERERRALTLRELAEQAGVTHVTLWRLENGITDTVRPSTVRKIAAALDVAPEVLLTWETEDQPGKHAA